MIRSTNIYMTEGAQRFHFIEFLLVAIPAAVFCMITALLLFGLMAANASVALQLFPVWVGGCLGVRALWKMYFRLYSGELPHNIKELPLIELVCGVTANVVAVFFFIYNARTVNHIAFSACFLIPSAVAMHWLFVLLNKRRELRRGFDS
ncbi:hypothetical protein ACO0LO_18755 [Undibacterium sp. TJN25]|uniref:hypothetical protein n=1 Tax=Undibacterium sp. TJN25 TaxID=3413056 RepID=UPI003BF1645D